MSSVSATGITGTTASAVSETSTSSLNDMGFDTFLKLLVTQLENQDPLNPMDGTEFTAQMATFAQLEQQMQSNQHLDNMSQANDYSAQAVAVSYMDKQVLAPEGSSLDTADVGVVEDGSASLAYILEEEAFSSEVTIYNSEGVLVKTLEGGTSKGLNNILWDGKNEEGEGVEEGFYKFQVKAYTPDGNRVSHQMYTYSPVIAVAADEEGIELTLLDGRETAFEDILQVVSLENFINASTE